MEKKKYFFSLILIFIVGALDAYCYMLHDGMFASMQTGNMIKVAIKIAHGDFVGFEKKIEKYAKLVMDGQYAFDYSEYSRKNWVLLNVCCLLSDTVKMLIEKLFEDKNYMKSLKKTKQSPWNVTLTTTVLLMKLSKHSVIRKVHMVT